MTVVDDSDYDDNDMFCVFSRVILRAYCNCDVCA